MLKRVVPLVLSTDRDYIFPTGVTLISILENAGKDTYYDVYILMPTDCNDSFDEILTVLRKKFINFSIHYVEIDNKKFENISVTNQHVHTPTYYRLLCAELLKKYDKCLCLDSDLLVYEDLSELYHTDMGECYIAGVKSWTDQQKTKENREHMLKNGLPTMDQYIYLGVLLMNLKQIRQDGMTSVFVEHMKKEYRSDDQDVFNVCCYNRIFFLPVRYNLLIPFYNTVMHHVYSIYGEEEWCKAQEKPAILHYPGRLVKPWLNLEVKCSNNWWEYAKNLEEIKSYKKALINRKCFSDSVDWNCFIEKIPSDKDVVLFGYSEIGKALFGQLKKRMNNVKIYFCDNDKYKIGESYHGISVLSPDQLKALKSSFVVIICSQLCYNTIKQQLINMGKLSERDIIIYIHKSKWYYKAIDRKYFDLALKEIFNKETGSDKYYAERGYQCISQELINGNISSISDHIKEKYEIEEWWDE